MQILGFLALPLGYVMEFIYWLIPNYGITLIVFTVLLRVLMFPLSLRQQKSTARQSAYQPMIQEIQKKWANDRQRQQVELQKFQEENGIKMTAGCLPLIINMVVLFSVIEVIYRPLQYILHIPAEVISAGELAIGITTSSFTSQSEVINAVTSGNAAAVAAVGEYAGTITGFNFNFLGLNLAMRPSTANIVTLILPVLSIATLFLSQIIVMSTSGQTQGKGMMWGMTIAMGVMFGFYAFTVPAGFSLYYTASNLVMTAQQMIVRRIYNPEKIREQVLAEIEERKKAKKAKKTVVLRDEKGRDITAELSEAEIVKLRLEKARKLDAQRYAEDENDSGGPAEAEAAAKETKAAKTRKGAKKKDEAPPPAENTEESLPEDTLSTEAEEAKAPPEEEAAPAEAPAQNAEPGGENAPDEMTTVEQKAEAKPGRRKRAKQNKGKGAPQQGRGGETESESFADKELRTEQQQDGEDK